MPPPEPLRALARDILAAPASRDDASPSSIPTPTAITSLTGRLHALASRTHHLFPRLATDVSTVPEGYGRYPNGPSPGAVVGIVLGSIAGFILLLWLIYWCVNMGGASSPPADVESGYFGAGGSSSVVSYRSRPRVVHRQSTSNRHTHSPRRRTKETIEISRRDVRREVSPLPPRTRSPGVDQIVVMEEHGGRSGSSRSRSRSRSMSVSRARARRMLDEDEIVVEEDHSTPPRRRDSRRSYRRRSSERRSGQYRDGDQYRFSGGSGSRRRSTSRRP
ncbi:uncharacterized protein F4807DRAFT_41292 [Annulohypoxylon truncatum]|uniref:uncharacterized protein n=1 Tax=Annulohypoxylon truncatum TaxID=327061 RepID=UPI002007DF28|nr:uncharacterized protein F4807DRAFT_41292 [Annulohypoxylon truncatum]KAI1210861.1 hypothetical protein F4807DRAFT_41292 [Annulohypoxylon truncatum]